MTRPCPITADRDEFRGAGTCATCMWVKTFKPRKDEQTRYDFGDVGYGCGKPGYEGYTQPFSSCSFHSARAHTAAASFVYLELVTPFDTAIGRTILAAVGVWVLAVMAKDDAA